MNKRKNITAIPNRVKDLLNLSPTQKQQSEVIETELQKIYESGKLKSNKHFIFLYLRKFLPILSNEQIQILKQKRDENKINLKKKKEKKYQQTYETSKLKLKSLNLTENQLQQYVAVKLDWYRLSMERIKKVKKIEGFLDKTAIEEEHVYPIFNSDQLELFKEISRQDKQREHLHRIKMESSRFHSIYNIELTEEQAHQLFDVYPMIPRNDETGEYYSEFEAIDLRYEKIKKILTTSQLEKYTPKHLQEVQYLENRYKKSNDEEHLKKLKESEASLNNYIDNILPLQCEARQRIDKLLSHQQKESIQYLRKIYFPIIEEQFNKIKASHFKYHKDFCPNELEVYNIGHKLNKINPNGHLLKGHKEVTELMTPGLIEIVKKEKVKLIPLFDRIDYIHHEEFEPEEGTVQFGWNIRLQRKKGDDDLKNLGLLLLEPEIENNLKKL